MTSRRKFVLSWASASAIFVVLLIAELGPLLREEVAYTERTVSLMIAKNGALPMPCGRARGTAGVDYDPATEDYPYCWYERDKFYEHFPEFKDLDYADLLLRFYRVIDPIEAEPWYVDAQTLLGLMIVLGFGIPFLSLMTGLAVRAVMARRATPT